MLFICSKCFRKKNNKLAWNCLDNLIYNSTETYLYQPAVIFLTLNKLRTANFEQVKNLVDADYEQVKNLIATS